VPSAESHPVSILIDEITCPFAKAIGESQLNNGSAGEYVETYPEKPMAMRVIRDLCFVTGLSSFFETFATRPFAHSNRPRI
jgi:hypothetical protein